MDRKTYSRTYNEHKQLMREAIRDEIERLKREDPERLAELQQRAQHELEHPPERPITRHSLSSKLRPHFNVAEFIRQTHTQSFHIHTKDCWGSKHLYFESLDGETAKEVLTRRHPKFVERNEEVVKVDKCECPLCQ